MKILPDLIAQKNFPDSIMFLTDSKDSYSESGRKNEKSARFLDLEKSRISVEEYLKHSDEYIAWYKTDQLNLKAKKKVKYKVIWKKVLSFPFIKKEIILDDYV